ncbi:MAG: TRIC cation channel family protein [Oscillospiraceae bacterium]|nr:TRIC cation channel family protein [Oscillospiraceae bacterium]MDY3065843.1 TRIC cation channel family protein [Oscillospiraceae bacterium]
MHYFIVFLELSGVVAASVSGAMTAMKKRMDIFGVMILGLITAVGGGVIRDITLGITPPATFRNPMYALTAVVTAVVVFLPCVQRLFRRFQRVYDFVLLTMDSIGLGIFTVIGVEAAFTKSEHCGMFLLCFVGVITGVGGGVLRDVLAGNMPYVFVKHIYACASLAGALVCIWFWPISHVLAMMLGAGSVVLIRSLSAHFHWSLPKARME